MPGTKAKHAQKRPLICNARALDVRSRIMSDYEHDGGADIDGDQNVQKYRAKGNNHHDDDYQNKACTHQLRSV